MSHRLDMSIAFVACLFAACVLWAVTEWRQRRRLSLELQRLRETVTTVRALLGAAEIRLWDTELVRGQTKVDFLGTSDRPEHKDAAPEFDWYSLVHPEDRAALLAARDQYLQKGGAFYAEYRIKNAQGEWRWNAANGLLRRDAEDKPTHFSGMSYDIHDRKVAEEHLREKEERLERALQNSRDGAYEADFRTGALWWAPNVMQRLGYSRDEIRTYDDLLSLMHADDRAASREAGLDHMDGKTPYCETEYRIRTKEGDWRWFRSRGAAERDAQGRPVRLTGMVNEVTEIKEYQLALIQATEQAQAGSRAKSEFLANMSHEIRTPMNGVLGMSELLLDTDLTDVQRDYVHTIRGSSIALLAIINDILDFSKVEAGKLELEHIRFDLREAIKQATKVIRIDANEKGLDVVTRIDDTLPRLVIGDPNRLRQILVNLLSNAVKFTARGAVTIELVRVTYTCTEVFFRCTVSDTGVGIPRDRLDALFEPFTQGDASTTRKFGGTGLGLSIVKRLAKLMGGDAGAESSEGVGSQFWFTARLSVPGLSLPAPESVLEAPVLTRSTRPSDESSAASRRRILVAEDNAVNQKVALHMLQRLGYDVTIANNGKEALDLWSTHEFTLILMDCQMPELDGYEATRMIRERETSGRIPIIALTAHAIAGAAQECLAAGMDDYLCKPLDRTRLCATLIKWLGKPWHESSAQIDVREC